MASEARAEAHSGHDRRHHRDGDDRKRDRSPHRKRKHRDENDDREHRSRRSKHHHRDHSSRLDRRSPAPAAAASLPYEARPLVRGDYAAYEPLFAMYLDVQKQLWLPDLDEREAKGRWKSFMKRWNRGELAGSYYDPDMLVRARRLQEEEAAEAAAVPAGVAGRNNTIAGRNNITDGDASDVKLSGSKDTRRTLDFGSRGREVKSDTENHQGRDRDDDDDEDDEWGPALAPGASASASPGHPAARQGPGIPNLQDLASRREDLAADRQDRLDDLRAERKADRREQKERLDELVPRADPGTRERKLEKRAAINDKMRSFRDKSPGVEEMREGELLGDGDELAAYKKELESAARRKTEREVRREEFERARNEERDERIREYRAREESTVEKLRELARQRFG